MKKRDPFRASEIISSAVVAMETKQEQREKRREAKAPKKEAGEPATSPPVQ